jgi:hypothetical protein
MFKIRKRKCCKYPNLWYEDTNTSTTLICHTCKRSVTINTNDGKWTSAFCISKKMERELHALYKQLVKTNYNKLVVQSSNHYSLDDK